MNPSTSSTGLRGLVATAIFIVLALSLSTVSAADPTFASHAVKFADLNISNPSGAHVLYLRILAAAQVVCSHYSFATDAGKAGCVRDAIADAVTKIPILSRRLKSPYPVPTLARYCAWTPLASPQHHVRVCMLTHIKKLDAIASTTSSSRSNASAEWRPIGPIYRRSTHPVPWLSNCCMDRVPKVAPSSGHASAAAHQETRRRARPLSGSDSMSMWDAPHSRARSTGTTLRSRSNSRGRW